MRVAIKEAFVYEGPVYLENTEDGPMTTCDFYAATVDSDGQEYIHLVPHRHRHEAGRRNNVRVYCGVALEPCVVCVGLISSTGLDAVDWGDWVHSQHHMADMDVCLPRPKPYRHGNDAPERAFC